MANELKTYHIQFKTEWPRASRKFENHYLIIKATSKEAAKRIIKSKYASMYPFAIKFKSRR